MSAERDALADLGSPLVEALADSQGQVLVVTGAGVSAASGVRTFRGSEPDAIWRQHDVSNATAEMFQRDPVQQLEWYLDRFAAVDTARPNAGHRALVDLERTRLSTGRGFLLVTQNIDTLHEQAGSRHLIKVHGSCDRMRCGRTGCEFGAPTGSIDRATLDLGAFRGSPDLEHFPRCPGCGGLLRAHVLFFDEYYTEHVDYRYPEVESAVRQAEVMLFVGTSFAVGVTNLALEAGYARGIPMFSIDPHADRERGLPVRSVQAKAEELLPVVVAGLTQHSGH